MPLNQAFAQHSVTAKNKIVAGFVLQLTSFVIWPEPQAPQVNVCIVGHEPFPHYIEKMIKSRPTNRLGQQIVIYRVTFKDNINHCQLIYSNRNTITLLAKKINNKLPILLVGNDEHYISNGGCQYGSTHYIHTVTLL